MHKFKNLPQDRNSLLGQGCTFKGDITADGDVRIDGTLNGNILKAHRLIIGKEGFINGNARCMEAEVLGRINGNLAVAGMLHLHEHAAVKGNIDAGNLRLESQSVYNGYLRTGKAVSTVKVLKEDSKDPSLQRRRIF